MMDCSLQVRILRWVIPGCLPIVLASLLHADIKGSPLVVPTVLSKSVIAEVNRGGEVVIPIPVISVSGGDVSIQISRKPNCGTLQQIIAGSGTLPVLRYENKASINSPGDSFEFRVKVQGQPWSTHTGLIRIKNLPGRLKIIPEKIDFGAVSIGDSSRRTLMLSNDFGSPVSGVLLLPSPWSIVGDGAFSLEEAQGKSFEILYSPLKEKSEMTELKVAPELSNFPVVSITGEGVVPFMIDQKSVVVSKEHPRADFKITNASAREMKVGWDDSTDLLTSPPLIVPPHGTAKAWVSIAPVSLDDDERKIIRPVLRQGSYSLPVEITAMGPKGKISLEADSKTFNCKMGSQLTVHGKLESTSSMDRSIEIRYSPSGDHSGEVKLLETLLPHSSRPLDLTFCFQTPGEKHPKVFLYEDGKSLQEIEWHGFVSREDHPHPVPTSTPQISTHAPVIPKGRSYILDPKDNGCVAAMLSSVIHHRLFSNTLLLKWIYAGKNTPEFAIEEKTARSRLSDRTGETPGDSWSKLSLNLTRQGMEWTALMPMPWPGNHIYRVYPEGFPQVIISEIMVPVTWEMFLWPAARAAMLIVFALCFVKVLRERL